MKKIVETSPLAAELHRQAQPREPRDDLSEAHRDNARLSLLRHFKRAEQRIARGDHTEKDTAALRLNIKAADEAFGRLTLCVDALGEERPALATEAWHNVHALFEAVYEIGGLSEISESAERRVVTIEKKRHQIRAGKARGKAIAEAYEKGWKAAGLALAKEYVAGRPHYKQGQLAHHIKAKLGNVVPQARQTITVISGWQKNGLLPKSEPIANAGEPG